MMTSMMMMMLIMVVVMMVIIVVVMMVMILAPDTNDNIIRVFCLTPAKQMIRQQLRANRSKSICNTMGEVLLQNWPGTLAIPGQVLLQGGGRCSHNHVGQSRPVLLSVEIRNTIF